jgi:hypothetical protein
MPDQYDKCRESDVLTTLHLAFDITSDPSAVKVTDSLACHTSFDSIDPPLLLADLFIIDKTPPLSTCLLLAEPC